MELKKNPLAVAVQSTIKNDIAIDTSGDEDFMEGQTYSWDELNTLKSELASAVMDFTNSVVEIVRNPFVTSGCLGEDQSRFDSTVKTFFSDINHFSNQVKELRQEHEHLSGPITDITGFNVYNRVSITYHNLFTELNALAAPSLSNLIILLTEVENKMAQAKKEKEAQEAPAVEVAVAETPVETKE